MRSDIIETATAEIGTIGGQKYLDWFGAQKDFHPDWEYCGIFCSWVYATAGHPLGIVDFIRGFASVPFAVRHWYQQRTMNPLPGDLVIFDWNLDKKPDHVGLFHSWIDKKAGLFYTIEGNTHPANNSNGKQQMKRQRNMAVVECFINPLGLPSDNGLIT